MYSDKAKRSAVYEPRARVGCVFVVGAAQSGKTEFAAALSAAAGLPVGETGEIILENLAAQLTALSETGLVAPRPYTEWMDIVRLGKCHWRTVLRTMGNMMTAIRGDSLIDPLIQRGARIVVGVRRHGEVEARLARGCKDVWVKIVRGPGFFPPEDSYELHEFERYCTVPVLVLHNGGAEELRAAAIAHAPKILEQING